MRGWRKVDNLRICFYYKFFLENQMFHLKKHQSQLNELKTLIDKKRLKLFVKREKKMHCNILIKMMEDWIFTDHIKIVYHLTGNFVQTCCIQQMLYIWFTICFGFYKILFMKKRISILLNIVNVVLSFVTKNKMFWEVGIKLLKRLQTWNKTVNVVQES